LSVEPRVPRANAHSPLYQLYPWFDQ